MFKTETTQSRKFSKQSNLNFYVSNKLNSIYFKLNPALVNLAGGPNLTAIPPMLTPIALQNSQNPNNIMMNQSNQMMQNPNFMPNKALFSRPIIVQPPQQRKMGQIDVIGSTDSTSRRPAYELDMNMQNQISVLGTNL